MSMHFAFRRAVRTSGLALCFFAAPALAEECPEGDWFCEPGSAAPSEAEPAPASEAAPAPEPERVEPPKARRVTLAHAEPAPPRRGHVRRVGRRVAHRRFALDLHVFGVVLRDSDADPDAGMGGVGAGLRYRPIPHLGLEGSLEFGLGTDYNGFDRREGALLASVIGFLNPENVVVVYALTGLGLGVADVSVDATAEDLPLSSHDERYRYFGMHLGGGVEVQVSRRAAVRAEFLGFVRTRTDDDRDERPEFVDPVSHRATNTSGGGLLRVGALFYF